MVHRQPSGHEPPSCRGPGTERAGRPGQGLPWLGAGGWQCCPARYSMSSRAMGPRAGWPPRVASNTIWLGAGRSSEAAAAGGGGRGGKGGGGIRKSPQRPRGLPRSLASPGTLQGWSPPPCLPATGAGGARPRPTRPAGPGRCSGAPSARPCLRRGPRRVRSLTQRDAGLPLGPTAPTAEVPPAQPTHRTARESPRGTRSGGRRSRWPAEARCAARPPGPLGPAHRFQREQSGLGTRGGGAGPPDVRPRTLMGRAGRPGMCSDPFPGSHPPASVPRVWSTGGWE